MDRSRNDIRGPQGDDGGGRPKKMKMALVDAGEGSNGAHPTYPGLIEVDSSQDLETPGDAARKEIVPYQAADDTRTPMDQKAEACFSFRYIICPGSLLKQEREKAKKKLEHELELVRRAMKESEDEEGASAQRVVVLTHATSHARLTDLAGPSNNLRTVNGNKLHEKAKRKAFKRCSQLLEKLMKQEGGYLFKYPVDAEHWQGVDDYNKVIKHPMDLGTVRCRMNSGVYAPKDFAKDVRLTFTNAMTYNPSGHPVHETAETMLIKFNDRWTAIETEYARTMKLAYSD